MYRTQMKMQLQKQHAEMLARKEEEEERKRRENQQIPQQSHSVDVPISKSVSNTEVPSDVLKVCVSVCLSEVCSVNIVCFQSHGEYFKTACVSCDVLCYTQLSQNVAKILLYSTGNILLPHCA